jgi:hypothetical protein
MAQRVPPQAGASAWERFITRIDRRYIYAGLFLFTLVPLVANLTLPLYVTPPAQSFYQSIEDLPLDRVVFVSSNWDAGTYAESEPQIIAIFRHLLRRRMRFVIFSVGYPNSPQLAQNALDTAVNQELPGRAPGDYPVYGVDYINSGFKVRNAPWVRSLVRDPAAALGADWKGKNIREFPLFAQIRTMPQDVSMLIDVTGSATTPMWIALVGPEGVRISLACTAVMAPEQYPYLATNQLTGMLTGMRGAAEYEKLLGFVGRATSMMSGQSFAHLYIFILIALGNVAIIRGWLARGRRG